MNVLTDPAKLAVLWARARSSFARLIADILTARAFTVRRYHLVRGWVGHLERIVQKLLYAEAAHLASPLLRADPAIRRRKPTLASASAKAAAASFSFAIPRAPRPPQRRVRGHRFAEPNFGRLSLRIEALRQALANPAPLAARLARLLVRRSPAIRTRFAIAGGRPSYVDNADPGLVIDVIGVALAAQYAFPDTS